MSIRLAGLLPLLLAGWSCGDKPDVYSISIPNLKIDADSSVVGIDIDINAGAVQAVQYIPVGWTFTINDDASWRTKIRCAATVQAASLSSEELKRVVFSVRRNETPTFKFDVSGDVVTNKTFENPKKIPVTMSDFSLTGTQ